VLQREVSNECREELGIVLEVFTTFYEETRQTSCNPDAPHQAPFPGFEAVFGTVWPPAPAVELPISPAEVSRLIRLSNRHVAIFETVSLFETAIRMRLREEDDGVDVWFVIVPEEIYQLGRPLSQVRRSERIEVTGRLSARVAQRLLKEPSLFEEEMTQAKVYSYRRLHGRGPDPPASGRGGRPVFRTAGVLSPESRACSTR
jgi:hypothetical protein